MYAYIDWIDGRMDGRIDGLVESWMNGSIDLCGGGIIQNNNSVLNFIVYVVIIG